MSSKLSKKYALLNTIGVLFYLIGTINVMWACLPFLPKLLQLATWLQPVAEPVHTAPVAPVQPPSLLMTIIAVAVTVVMLGVTIYILVKLPRVVGKTGHKLTVKASNYVIPVITHHTPLTATKRHLLSARVMIYLKLSVCVLPIIVAAFSILCVMSLPYSLVMLVAALLSLATLLLLTLQLVAAHLLHVTFDRVW